MAKNSEKVEEGRVRNLLLEQICDTQWALIFTAQNVSIALSREVLLREQPFAVILDEMDLDGSFPLPRPQRVLSPNDMLYVSYHERRHYINFGKDCTSYLARWNAHALKRPFELSL